jgi:hypothetical protein
MQHVKKFQGVHDEHVYSFSNEKFKSFECALGCHDYKWQPTICAFSSSPDLNANMYERYTPSMTCTICGCTSPNNNNLSVIDSSKGRIQKICDDLNIIDNL